MKKALFSHRWMPYLLLFPQLSIIAVFFLWPAAEGVHSSFFLEDPFFGNATYVGLDNYTDALTSSDYSRVAGFTLLFTVTVALASLGLGLLLAVSADRVLRGKGAYKTLLMWVYAIAPPVAGLMGVMLFDQHIGPIVKFVEIFGWNLQRGVDYWDTAFVLIVISVWKQLPYNFIFFLSGLQAISGGVKEAARIDCRSEARRFWTITFPLLAPTSFFLLILNITYAMFETFGTIDVLLGDQPGNSPITLVYKVYRDGFRGSDIGGSSAQSVILMLVVLVLTIVQFRLIERRVHYS